jgi:ornithine carbamoyltransferase
VIARFSGGLDQLLDNMRGRGQIRIPHAEINDIFDLAVKLKKHKLKFANVLKGKTLYLIFHKPSLRTRVSFEVGMTQLGGNAIYLKEDIGLGLRETIADTAKIKSKIITKV